MCTRLDRLIDTHPHSIFGAKRKNVLIFHLKIINYHSLKMYFGGIIILRGGAASKIKEENPPSKNSGEFFGFNFTVLFLQ